ncbi:MAG: hypothetical protein JZU55_14005 [Afipia sp.]|nr:hypothetical protein [Afipia sp.]
MARTKATFKQADLHRAMRAIEATGGRVTHVEVHSNKVILFMGTCEIKAELSPYDQWKNKHANQA